MTPAETLTTRLGGKWHGSYGTARCPGHDDRSPSLTIRNGDRANLLKCKAGCAIEDILAALRRVGVEMEAREVDPVVAAQSAEERRQRAERALERCRQIWNGARSLAGTPAVRYLAERGLVTPETRSLRFAASCPHPSGSRLPALVARIDDVGGRAIGLQRTYLRPDGSGKADIDPDRAMLGSAAGGAVRLSPLAPELIVGEGVETVLAAMQAAGIPGWAALSTSGLLRLSLPASVESVIVAADNDRSGAGERAARAAAQRWAAEGRRARLALPPAAGLDFNDMLRGFARGAIHA